MGGNHNKSLYKSSLDFNSRGFTLIELITALGVFTILATAAMVVLDPVEQFNKSADTRRKADLAQVQKALEIYYQDHGRYPYAYQNRISLDGTGNTDINWGETFAPYMDVLPIDPKTAKNYAYSTDITGQQYALYASLDRGSKDQQACNGGAQCTGAAGITCGGVCNYGVTSPNISP